MSIMVTLCVRDIRICLVSTQWWFRYGNPLTLLVKVESLTETKGNRVYFRDGSHVRLVRMSTDDN